MTGAISSAIVEDDVVKVLRAIAAAALLIGTACGDSDPTGGTNNNTLTATINGTAYVPMAVSASRGVDRVYISATTAASQQVTLTLRRPATTGTVELAPNSTDNVALVGEGAGLNNSVWSSAQASVPGTVTFTEFSNAGAAGTFEFTAAALAGTPATGTRTVTNGTFNVKF